MAEQDQRHAIHTTAKNCTPHELHCHESWLHDSHTTARYIILQYAWDLQSSCGLRHTFWNCIDELIMNHEPMRFIFQLKIIILHWDLQVQPWTRKATSTRTTLTNLSYAESWLRHNSRSLSCLKHFDPCSMIIQIINSQYRNYQHEMKELPSCCSLKGIYYTHQLYCKQILLYKVLKINLLSILPRPTAGSNQCADPHICISEYRYIKYSASRTWKSHIVGFWL